MNHPIRSESHKIDEKSILLIQSTIVDNWIARSQEGRDYGIDLQIERFDGENPTGDFIFAQVKGTKDTVINNFPKLTCLWCSSIVPARKIVIKDNLHIVKETIGALFPCSINLCQNIHGYF
jgi:hypothetical protein